jgi:hypothetical protein
MIRYRNLTVIPSYHSNLDFVHEVRLAFYSETPDIIAVEFPENLASLIQQGVNRLPKISLVMYFDDLLKEQMFVPIDPADSLIEAVRLGTEYGIPVEFIDLFVKNYTPVGIPHPDSYVLNHMSLTEFYDLYRRTLALDQFADAKFQAQKLTDFLTAAKRDAEGDQLESEDDSSTPNPWQRDSEELERLRNDFMASKLAKLMREYDKVLVVMGLAHWEPIRTLLDHEHFSDEFDGFIPDIYPEIFNIEASSLPEIMLETPNVVYQWELFRTEQKERFDEFSSQAPRLSKAQIPAISELISKFRFTAAIQNIYHNAIGQYKTTYNESISPHKLKSLMQYLRNLPLAENMLTPHLFDIVLAAKSIVNDDFAWIVWEECKKFPPADTDPKMESLDIEEGSVFLKGKQFKLRRMAPIKIAKIKVPLKPKPQEVNKGEWKKIWDRNRWHVVSYEPEDLYEENYFQHVRRRTLGIVRDQFTRIHKFTSTLLDGIDFRETIRNWPIEHAIFVKEEQPVRGDVDAVVIIFDRDERNPERYPHKSVWYAEHEKESDLGLYCTHPGQNIVGPGISRVELGGIVSFFPPRNIPDLWFDKTLNKYEVSKTKADRLLLAGLVYSQKKFITYIAEKPPSAIFHTIAQKVGMKILYLPLERFNPVSIRALRNLHMLAGKETRKFAHEFIRKRRY